MSSNSDQLYSFYLKEITIYVGISLLILGCIGGLFNLIVFLSLKTFRENPCGFYLIIISLVNIGHLITGLLIRILIVGYEIDLTLVSSFSCKFFQYLSQLCALTSLTCLCLATIDQYLNTHIRQRYQSQIRIAYRLSLITIVIWLIHGIPYLIYYNVSQSSLTGKYRCRTENAIFSNYFRYFYTVALTGYIPVIISILFGLLAYLNVRKSSNQIIPLLRRELDKQLTTMVLLLDVFNIISLMPYPVFFTINSLTNINKDPFRKIQFDFIINLTFYFYYLYFTVRQILLTFLFQINLRFELKCPFYIFICVSERFRRQLIYVVFKIHLEHWRRHRMIAALVLPR